jgi:hypothetical protein
MTETKLKKSRSSARFGTESARTSWDRSVAISEKPKFLTKEKSMKTAQYAIVLGMMPAANSNAKLGTPVTADYNPGRKTSERAGDMFEEIGALIDEGFDKAALKVSFLSPFYSVTVNDLPDSAECDRVESPTSLARIRFVSSNVTDLVDAVPDVHDEAFHDNLLELA